MDPLGNILFGIATAETHNAEQSETQEALATAREKLPKLKRLQRHSEAEGRLGSNDCSQNEQSTEGPV